MKKVKQLLFADNHPVARNIISAALYSISLLSLDLFLRWIYADFDTSPLGKTVPLLFSLCWVIILTALSFILPRLARRIYQIATVVLYSIITLIHGFFICFFGNYMTMSSAIFAEDGADFFDWSYFPVSRKTVLLVICAVTLSVFSALTVPAYPKKYSLKKILIPIAAFLIGIFGVIGVKSIYINDNGTFAWDSKKPVIDIYESFTDTNSCMHMLGLYQYTFRDFCFVSGLNDLAYSIATESTINGLDSFYEEKEIDSDNEMTGIFEDKNLILIQLESIDTWMVNDISMPFFSQLSESSINFTEFYASKFLYASTFNTEYIVNTGFIPPINSTKTSYFTENYYPYSLANLFKSKGYSVESYHRSNGGIYNRSDSHVNWGYEKYNSGYDMGLKNYDLDTALMTAYDMFCKDEKFMSFIITYSGHGPYDGTSDEVALYYDIIKPQLPADAEDEYIWALCHAYETDMFIKQLYEGLKADGKLENTVLIFYSDHYDHYMTGDGLLEKYKGSEESDLWCQVPFIIYSHDTQAQNINKTLSSYDILPTIANLFSLDSDGRYYVGNDAFSDNGGYAFFRTKSWYNGETYMNTNADDYDNSLDYLADEITERLNASINTVKTNYFSHTE